MAAMAMLLLYWTLEQPRAGKLVHHGRECSPPQPLHRNFDTLGLLTLICSIATPLLAINLGGSVLPWGHPVVILLLTLTPFQIAGFIYIEIFIATQPIVQFRLFKGFFPPYIMLCSIPAVMSWNQVSILISRFQLQRQRLNKKGLFKHGVLYASP